MRFIDYVIRPARLEDIGRLAPTLREMDRRELWAIARLNPEAALRLSLTRAARAYTALTGGGEVIQMWGVCPRGGLLGLTGSPWLLGAAILERPEVAREFIRQSRPYARELETGFRRLENWVHADNRLARRWLSWLGFEFADRPEAFNGEPFYHFWKEM